MDNALRLRVAVAATLVATAGASALANATGAATAAIAVSVDAGADVHPFSPLIFGVAFGDGVRNAEIGYPLRRWGGNSTTRYNWQVDVHSTASDWYFENIPGASDRTHVPPLGNDADAFIGEARAYGADVLLTIPTIGWTPRADSPQQHPYFAGFSVAKYGAQEPPNPWTAATDPWDPDAGSGECLPANNPSPNCVPYGSQGGHHLVNNDPHDTSSEVVPAFWKDWIAHLQSTFGGATSGGVRYYALDNEVMLWNSTHRDVHPTPTTFDETWNKALAYGAAIKQQDPAAKVTGPVTWGYCDLFGSAADNCAEGSDRDAHGGLPFVAWYLQQVCANPLAGGARAVDVLDLHYYPQGDVALNDDDSASTAARRLRSLKELYDPAWVSESWIADLGDNDENHYSKPNLIPRVRGWIGQYCPGTKLAITEYNWGNDGTTSGAVAQAELFGIFAREGVDMATRWVAPESGSVVERAYTLFLDYDGAGARVQGNSVRAQSANVDAIGAYAFNAGGRTMVLLTNKTTTAQDVAVAFASAPGTSWTLYGFDATHAVHVLATGSVAGTSVSLSGLPAMSANLLVVTGADSIFRNGFD
ncbi:glycoside hydrolase family 44 protein [Dokdonella sp.]|uniref:glycoside hydrolase family 44 protein n=1 Tax=Dokdonella sp. TaxID=2291710 RepID=UPI002F42BFDE